MAANEIESEAAARRDDEVNGIRGGQGRTAESVEASAWIGGWCFVGAAAIVLAAAAAQALGWL